MPSQTRSWAANNDRPLLALLPVHPADRLPLLRVEGRWWGVSAEEVKAYDLTKFQRLIGVDSKRVTGKFMVLGFPDRAERNGLWISAIDVVVWSEDKSWGQGLTLNDLTTLVEEGVEPDLSIREENRNATVAEVRDEMIAALRAVAAEYLRATGDPA